MNLKISAKDSVKNSYNLRIFLLMLVISVFIGLISIRLFNLQILNHDYYKVLAANQHGLNATIEPSRGQIYLTPQGTNAQPLLVATNLTKNMVYAIPKNVSDKRAAAQKLSPILQMSVADLTAKLNNPSYVSIKKGLSEEDGKKIKALKIPGIYLEAQNVRFYPENTLASQIIGFLGFKGDDRVGQYGVEGKFNEQLAGRAGSLNTTTSASGSWIDVGGQNLQPARDGDDFYLTIDPTIEFKAEEVLKAAVQTHGADSGSIVIVNPKTGAILAMANVPDFDPNNYGQIKDQSAYNNRAASADYEAGSVFKAMTMAAALNENKVTPETTFDNTGMVQVDDKLIKNSEPNKFLGLQNMITVLDESLNTGAFFAEQQVGNDKFKDYVQKFGWKID
jgi:cell division protein FtsI/penicillin-binding protein 2